MDLSTKTIAEALHAGLKVPEGVKTRVRYRKFTNTYHIELFGTSYWVGTVTITPNQVLLYGGDERLQRVEYYDPTLIDRLQAHLDQLICQRVHPA